MSLPLLQDIRNELIRLEDTILFGLIERSKFALNRNIYKPGAIEIPNWDQSFLTWILHETECVHAKVRRFCALDEYPFTENLPSPILPALNIPEASIIKKNDFNINDKILSFYVNDMVPKISKDCDDPENYGSAAVEDVGILQALSRRIHLGKFVCERKFREHEEQFTALIKAKDAKGIYELITDKQVEDRLLERVKFKAQVYGAELNDQSKMKQDTRIDPDIFTQLYRDYLIPYTKEVQVTYLLHRLN